MECLTPCSSLDSYMFNETIYFDTNKNGGQNSVSGIWRGVKSVDEES